MGVASAAIAHGVIDVVRGIGCVLWQESRKCARISLIAGKNYRSRSSPVFGVNFPVVGVDISKAAIGNGGGNGAATCGAINAKVSHRNFIYLYGTLHGVGTSVLR